MKTINYLKNIGLGVLFGVVFLFGFSSVAAAYCEPSPSGNLTINSSCTFAKLVAGVDGGADGANTARLIVNNGVLTINANQSLVFGFLELTGGSISVDVGAQMMTGTPIWMIDADADGYPATTTEYAQATAPANGRRRNLMTSISEVDCSESFFSTTNTCCSQLTWYRDVDGDGYGNPGGPTTTACAPVPSGYSANNTDCDDAQALVFTSHAACFWDNDGDTYTNGNASGKTCLNSASCNTATRGSLGGGVAPTAYTAGRIRDAANGTDCDEAQAAVYISHAACYWDLDGDTYTAGNVSGKTCLNSASCNTATQGSLGGGVAPTAYTAGRLRDAANGTDCYDQNINAWPGQTICYTADRGDGSFDYDCSGAGASTGCPTIYNRSATGTSTSYSQSTGSCNNCNMACGSGSNTTYGVQTTACGALGGICTSNTGKAGGSCSCTTNGCSYGCKKCSSSGVDTNMCNGVSTGTQACR